jgi:catechol 2,3-dioxygenase-like lactoylglutathione lyase family enzyme
MKRLHLHIKVDDIDQSARFYAALFGREPDKREPDYAKWMLDDPRANVAISKRNGAAGVDHVGVQVESDAELDEIAARVRAASADIVEEADATCCYARSNKYWAKSPEGAVWELFHTFGDSKTYGAVSQANPETKTAACCTPAA